jgi:hypothetical protein
MVLTWIKGNHSELDLNCLFCEPRSLIESSRLTDQYENRLRSHDSRVQYCQDLTTQFRLCTFEFAALFYSEVLPLSFI